MERDTVEIVCPECGAPVTLSSHEREGLCEACGCTGIVPTEACATAELPPRRQTLVADLQRAYQFQAEKLAMPGTCWLGAGGGSALAIGDAVGMSALSPGAKLGDYVIIEELGRGGMGIVYRARQISLGREVALKVLPAFARHGRTAVRRFQSEAHAAARLHHTNVVPVYGQGRDGDLHFYAMELIDGISLDAVIRGHPDLLGSSAGGASSTGWALKRDRNPKPREPETRRVPQAAVKAQVRRALADYRHIAALLAEVADGLHCAHEHGIVHRDVKPHNLLLSCDDRLYLTDFGLALLTEEPHLTLAGEIMGTPAYLSPEQVHGLPGKVDRQTDVYSLGVTLYEIITGRKPFTGETREQIIHGILHDEPPPPRRIESRIPVDLETICLRAMSKSPQQRHANAADLAEDLRRFADGRPILSRRVGPVGRALKWARRRKPVAACLLVAVAASVFAVGWSWSIHAGRVTEAERLLSDAYEQLAYRDYHAPGLVAADVERAAALGADGHGLHTVQALLSLGNMDQQAAIEQLQTILESNPRDQRALYMLAWANWRDGQRPAAEDVFARAEDLGAPTSADTWFFRGLAAHYADPALAIESYREAAALRGRAGGFYAQAVLHLARALNQQLYASRDLGNFSEAEASLRQLVEHESYGAYPYYLLSIAHRLAAEIYSGSSGTRDESLVNEHFGKALEWARRGQLVEPAKERCVAAEAECLESMGLYNEAIEARDRALALADQDMKRWEHRHYRWRLHYWTGAYELALDDLAECARYAPDSRFYSHVYPLLVLADMGRLPEALEQAHAIADESDGGALDVIWSATCLRLLGRGDEATALLDQRADTVDFQAGLEKPQSREWAAALYTYCRTGGTTDDLDALAGQVTAPWKLWGEARFHAGALQLSAGDREAARAEFLSSYRSFDSEQRYTYHAKTMWNRMRMDSAWPPWISPDVTGARLWAAERGLAAEPPPEDEE